MQHLKVEIHSYFLKENSSPKMKMSLSFKKRLFIFGTKNELFLSYTIWCIGVNGDQCCPAHFHMNLVDLKSSDFKLYGILGWVFLSFLELDRSYFHFDYTLSSKKHINFLHQTQLFFSVHFTMWTLKKIVYPIFSQSNLFTKSKTKSQPTL